MLHSVITHCFNGRYKCFSPLQGIAVMGRPEFSRVTVCQSPGQLCFLFSRICLSFSSSYWIYSPLQLSKIPFSQRSTSLPPSNVVFYFFLLPNILKLNSRIVTYLFFQQTFIEDLSAGHCAEAQRWLKHCVP